MRRISRYMIRHKIQVHSSNILAVVVTHHRTKANVVADARSPTRIRKHGNAPKDVREGATYSPYTTLKGRVLGVHFFNSASSLCLFAVMFQSAECNRKTKSRPKAACLNYLHINPCCLTKCNEITADKREKQIKKAFCFDSCTVRSWHEMANS